MTTADNSGRLLQEMSKLWQEYTAQVLQSPEQQRGMAQLMEMWGGLAASMLPAYSGVPYASRAPFPAAPAAAAFAAPAVVLPALLARLDALEQRLAVLEQRGGVSVPAGA